MKKVLIAIAAISLFTGETFAQNLKKDLASGIKYYNYERYQSASKVLMPLVKKDWNKKRDREKAKEANYYLGLSQIGLHEYDKAKATFNNKSDGFYGKAGLARIDFIQNKPEKAEKLLQEIVDHARRKDWEKFKVAADAITYTKGGDVQKAITWYQKALDTKDEGNAMLLIGLGDAYLKKQNGGGSSMDNYENAVKVGTHNSLAFSRIGYLWYAAQNYDAALKSYKKAKDADTTNPLPYRNLANAYQMAGNYKYALKNDKIYLAKSDRGINDQIQYANILFQAKKYNAAEKKMEDLINSGHERPYMYRIIGYSAYETGNTEKALENMKIFFEKVKDTANIIPDDYMYLGKIYGKMAAQDTLKTQAYAERAEKNYMKAVAMKSDTNNNEIYKEIADAYKEAKLYGKTGEWYGKIIAEDSDAPAIDYFYWGYWSFIGKNYDKADSAFERMIAKYPKEGSAYYWYARVKAAQDTKAKEGLAVEPYKNWLDFEADGYEKKDKQLMYAYQYLAYYYYNAKEEEKCMKWANKILEKDPENKFAKSLVDYYKKLDKAKAAQAKQRKAQNQ